MELTVKHLHTGDTSFYTDVRAVGTAFDEDGELMVETDTRYKLSLHTVHAIEAGSADTEVLIAAASDADDEWAKTLHNIEAATEIEDNEVEVVFEDGTERTHTDARIFGAAEDPYKVPHRRYVPGVTTEFE